MPFLLMVFLTLVCLPDEGDWPHPSWIPSAGASAGLTAAGVLALVGYAWLLARRTRRALLTDPVGREAVLARYERGRAAHRLLVFAVYAAALLLFGWGRAAYHLWGAGEGQPWPAVTGGQPWPGAELVLLAPFLVSLTLSWACFYAAERAAHDTAGRILGIDPASREWLDRHAPPLRHGTPFGGRRSYLLFQLRQKLALVFIPLSLLLVLKELRRHVPESGSAREVLVDAAGFAVVIGVFVGMPWLVRLALGLRPMPAGPLRDRLFAAARRLHFRFSDVLLWHTRGGMANAMVVGLVPWPRYVVLTDRLVEDFGDDEIEAVFGHEVGHVKHRHMLYYLSFLSGSVLLLWLCEERLMPVVGHFPTAGAWLDGWLRQSHGLLSLVPLAGLSLGYIFVVFGFLSRRCERQADVFGCRAVSCLYGDCQGHDGREALPEDGRGLCPSGIRTFVRTLEKVARVNGISRDRPGFLQSWQHSTIARRVDFLQRLLEDPGE